MKINGITEQKTNISFDNPNVLKASVSGFIYENRFDAAKAEEIIIQALADLEELEGVEHQKSDDFRCKYHFNYEHELAVLTNCFVIASKNLGFTKLNRNYVWCYPETEAAKAELAAMGMVYSRSHSLREGKTVMIYADHSQNNKAPCGKSDGRLMVEFNS